MSESWMTRRALRWVVIVLVLVVAGANARILFGGTWDDVRYHTEISPPRLAAAAAIQHGALPAWWEGSGLGVPLASEPSHGAMYPPVWVASSPRAFDWLCVVHLMWLAIGVAVWARRTSPRPPRHRAWIGEASEPSAIVVALLVATSGLVSSAALRGALPALAHLPWIGFAACTLADAETRHTRARAAAVLGVALGLVGLAGNLAGLVDALVVALALGVRRWPLDRSHAITPGETRDRTTAAGEIRSGDTPGNDSSDDRDGAARKRRNKRESRSPDDRGAMRAPEPVAIYLIAAIAGGLAIAAAQWLPALLHEMSPHAGAEVSGLPLSRLVELVVPTASGSSDLARAIPALAGDHAWAPSIFVGASLLALAAVRVPSRRVLAVIGVLALLALVAGRGGWPAWTGAPEVHLAALAIVLGAHAGTGIDALVDGERRALLAVAAGVGCSVVALIAVAVQRSRALDPAPFEVGLINGAIGAACSLGALAIAWRGRGNRLPAVFALLVIPSFGAGPAIAPTIEGGLVASEPAWAEAALAVRLDAVVPLEPKGNPADAASSASPTEPAWSGNGSATAPGAATPSSGTIPNRGPRRVYRAASLISNLEGRATVSTPTSKPAAEPAERESVADAIETLAGTSAWRWQLGAARSDDPARHVDHDATWLAAASNGGRLLDRFGIGLAILPELVVAPRGFTPLGRRGRWALVAMPVAPPAAVMRSWVRAVEPSEAFSLLFPYEESLTLPRGTIVLGEPGDAQPPKPKAAPLPCAIEDWSAGNIELSCTTDARGYATISSSAAPGWSVTVDGTDARWASADVLRRAVELPAGTHRVHWTYSAPGLSIGLAIAGIGLALLLALALASRR